MTEDQKNTAAIVAAIIISVVVLTWGFGIYWEWYRNLHIAYRYG